MRRHAWVWLGLLAAGCGSARVVAAPVREAVSAASCAAVSPARQFAGARLVFVGAMFPGPTAVMGGRRILASPATMRVERYLKGRGPRTVRIVTAVRIRSDSTTVAEDGIEPRPGERWKIFTTSRRQPFDTSMCGGSARVTARR